MKTVEEIKAQIEEYRKFICNEEYDQLMVAGYIEALEWVLEDN